MFVTLGTVAGGVGLFLLGIGLLTDGLKTVAGDALRRVLARFTGGRFTAALSGAGVTALVQSSSATTVATLGFVSAGLLTFQQALGVIIGANVGTTSTGWLVSLLGLKFSVSVVALPLVGVGALARLLTRGRAAAFATAVAGFGLVFVGIDTLQAGMKGFDAVLTPDTFPADGVLGEALLILVGIVMTVVLQSSSAAVATTLAALDGGALTLEQAAAMVIGQNVGTTVTAALACIGASTHARRTALAHILFNLVTGAIAFSVLGWLVIGTGQVVQYFSAGSQNAVSLAAFHTAFNLLGAALFLPFLRPFARVVERLVPDRGPVLGRHLDATVAKVPALATDAARRTLHEIASLLLTQAIAVCERGAERVGEHESPGPAALALDSTRAFVTQVPAVTRDTRGQSAYLAVLHALDHGEQLEEVLREALPSHRALRAVAVRGEVETAVQGLRQLAAWLAGDDLLAVHAEALAEETSRTVAQLRKEQRPVLLDRSARGELRPDDVLAQLDAMRWVDRVAYHAWRIVYHLTRADSAAKPPEAASS